MGWSFAVACKSAKAHQEILSFLEEHYTPLNPERPKHPTPYTKYAYSKYSIGFDSPTKHEQAVLRWIALRAGKKRTSRSLLGPETPAVPWVNLDGQGSSPVITKDQWDGREETEQYVVDEHGFQPDETWLGEGMNPLLKSVITTLLRKKRVADHNIKKDLIRLDTLWQNRNEG